MRASTILESNNINSFIDSEVISKLLICYYRNISDNLIKLNSKLEKNNKTYITDYINDDYKQESVLCRKTNLYIQKHKDVNFKKHNVIMNIFKYPSIKFCCIDNYIYPMESGVCDNISPPIITDKYILFYNFEKQILMIFTYIPMNYAVHNIKNYKSHILVRDLNCYIIDNVSNEIFVEYIENNIVSWIDYRNDILKYNSISIKISDYKNDNGKKVELLRLVKEDLNSDPVYKINGKF